MKQVKIKLPEIVITLGLHRLGEGDFGVLPMLPASSWG